MLQTAALQATLATRGGPAAMGVLNRYPGLRTDHLAMPIVAHALWEAGEKMQAIELLKSHIQAQPGVNFTYAQLAAWQFESGLFSEAVETALKACQCTPKEPAPRLLLLEVVSAKIMDTPAWSREIATYLRDFAGRSDAIILLAQLAGRRGWPDLVRSLYAIGSARHEDLGRLALCYSDALAAQSQVKAARAVLAQIEQQVPERNSGFLLQLRPRQVLLAAASGDRDQVREYSRRIAALLHNDTDSLTQFRQYYVKLGLNDAVAEFPDAPAGPKPQPSPK
jgi:hypothetical protein